MPTVDDSFRYTTFNPAGLKPERGWTYETGVKVRRSRDTWKVAVYRMSMANKMGWRQDPVTMNYYATNVGDFRNTGLEVEYTRNINGAWRYTLGGAVSNPQIKDPSNGRGWIQDAGRVEGLIRIDYEKAKWQGNLNLKYLGDREYYVPSAGVPQDTPDKVQLNMNIIYNAGKFDTITLGLYNLLNRTNYLNCYGSIDLPRNFRLNYTHAF